jgi:hypothetical protein
MGLITREITPNVALLNATSSATNLHLSGVASKYPSARSDTVLSLPLLVLLTMCFPN